MIDTLKVDSLPYKIMCRKYKVERKSTINRQFDITRFIDILKLLSKGNNKMTFTNVNYRDFRIAIGKLRKTGGHNCNKRDGR